MEKGHWYADLRLEKDREILSQHQTVCDWRWKSKSARKLEEAELERLQKIAAELQVENNIIFLGAKKQKHLCRYYSASDVCVVPSYYEPFGIVPVESMACGTPVIAFVREA